MWDFILGILFLTSDFKSRSSIFLPWKTSLLCVKSTLQSEPLWVADGNVSYPLDTGSLSPGHPSRARGNGRGSGSFGKINAEGPSPSPGRTWWL